MSDEHSWVENSVIQLGAPAFPSHSATPGNTSGSDSTIFSYKFLDFSFHLFELLFHGSYIVLIIREVCN